MWSCACTMRCHVNSTHNNSHVVQILPTRKFDRIHCRNLAPPLFSLSVAFKSEVPEQTTPVCVREGERKLASQHEPTQMCRNVDCTARYLQNIEQHTGLQ